MKTSFKIIKWLFGIKFFDRKIEKFDKIDPNRFYVENIRSYFGMSYFAAQRLCDEAVNNGKFEKKIGLECPKCHRIIKSFENANSIKNDRIVCDVCASLEENVYEFDIKNLKRINIYSLHKG